MTALLFALLMSGCASTQMAVVLKPVADMYSRPSRDADVVSQAIYGSNVAVQETGEGWLKIQTSDEYSGWVPAEHLRVLASGERPYASSASVQVESLFAHIYHEPSVTKRRPMLTVPFETRLEPAGSRFEDGERWIKVRLPDNARGWIQKGDVTAGTRVLSMAETIDLARRFLGLPYTWGGTSSFGYDCSGFVQMLYRKHGISLPRDSRPQARWKGFVAVEGEEPVAGDLLYFGSAPEKITHTGMYIGDDQFIHATAHEKPVIQISRLADPHWSQLLVAIRRLK